MGTGDILLGETLHGLASDPGETTNTPSYFMLQPCDPLAFLLPFDHHRKWSCKNKKNTKHTFAQKMKEAHKNNTLSLHRCLK